VYRITEASVKQALDAGFSTQDVEEFLQKYIAGEVPQAISYLLADLARQQGLLRAGTASCYVRCEDEEFLARAVDATPGLRLLAPTVAVSQMSLNAMLESLRRAGFQPAAEDSHGMTLDLRPKPPRISTPQPNIYSPEKKAHDIAELIKQIRKAERDRTPATVEQQRPPDIVATLQAALRGGRTVTLGFVDKHGIASVRQVQPITVSQGQLDRITEVIVDN
ncbi:MAG: helicase-associated domain-containing protein, partial [Corynebacterium sp.]|nr:helicase-associated domain-containing protein [Corynebacterium sp.]